MGALSEFEGKTPKEMRNLCLEALKQASPRLLEEGMEKYKEFINSDDPAVQKMGIDIWKTLMNKALPNQTKHEVEVATQVDKGYMEYLAIKEQKRKRLEMKEADYEVQDE
jgi:23S rRNA G2445 N2-methylase RlmL